MPAILHSGPAPAAGLFANKMAFTTSPLELKRRIDHDGDVTIVDVREPEAYRNGHVPGSRNLPREKWASCEGLNQNGVNVLYSESVSSPVAAEAAEEFAAHGFLVMELDGGFEGWKQNKLPIEK
jgi:thiosulfate sulfurtransferase